MSTATDTPDAAAERLLKRFAHIKQQEEHPDNCQCAVCLSLAVARAYLDLRAASAPAKLAAPAGPGEAGGEPRDGGGSRATFVPGQPFRPDAAQPAGDRAGWAEG